ncbi:MAG: ABC transporter permease [Porphyromonadaceae bacterium]|nr:MAG: ABC transporter permease [Porphyromonadaceae bacterium]
MIPSLSWKNIWRNKVRSLVVIAAMTFGIFGGLFTSAIYKGMSDRRVKEALTKEVAHIQIHDPKFIENPEIGLTLPDPGGIVRFAEGLPGVKAATDRLKIVTMINSSAASSGVTVYGIDPDKEKEVSELYTSVYDSLILADKLKLTDPALIGTYLKDSTGSWFGGSQRNPIVIGETLARKLKLKINSKVVLTFQSADGSLTGGSYRVCGIYRLENNAFEEMNVYVRKPDLASLAALTSEDAHEVTIFMNDPKKVGSAMESIRAEYPDLDVMDWKTLLPDVAMLNDLLVVSMIVIMVIILAALGFGIVNTMLMVVLERVKELGMLIAVGMNKLRVFNMIILESVLLCLTGAIAGMGISAVVIEIFNKQGIDLTAYAQKGMEAWGYSAVMYPNLSWNFYLIVAALVVITGIAASAYPAWKALKLNPADALRTE